MLCHSAVGACQIYASVRGGAIYYKDGYHREELNIVQVPLVKDVEIAQ